MLELHFNLFSFLLGVGFWFVLALVLSLRKRVVSGQNSIENVGETVVAVKRSGATETVVGRE